MAESKNSFIQSKMNKDLDEKLIPNNVYRDALNIAVSRSEGSDVGALEAILGNTKITNSLSGSSKIIGYIVDNANSFAYLFTTDYSGSADILPGTVPLVSYRMAIQRYNVSSGQLQTLVTGNFLNFSTLSPIYGVNLLENLLFWSDNRNAPRKINIDSAVSDVNYYTDPDQISVAKFAPYKPIEFLNLRSIITPGVPFHPSTMTDAADLPYVRVGLNDVASINLSTTKYRNGDPITFAQSLADWQAANSNQEGAWCYYDNDLGNGVNYGVLYNKWAVLDTRNIAPIGYEVATEVQWDNMLDNSLYGTTPSAGPPVWDGAGVTLKTEGNEFWTVSGSPSTNEGQDFKGFRARGGGERQATGSGSDFAGLKNIGTWWTSSATNDNYYQMDYNTPDAEQKTQLGVDPKLAGRSIRCIRNSQYNGWNGDPDFLKDKFAKFSYRFKFDDNEYSVAAPFSQDMFIPEQQGQFVNDDENDAFITTVVEFMQNSVNNAVLNITLPCIDILNEYKITGIDILIKESDAQAYSVLESVVVDQDFISNLNNTNIYQYTYESLLPIKTLTLAQTTRVFDKVPITALAQESAGNRIMYGNFDLGYGAPLNLDYYVEVPDNAGLGKNQQDYIEYPNHSLKQNRNYQAGIVLADKYGRQTDIILSSYDDQLDSQGNPIPGSNVYSNYKPLSFTNDVEEWRGDNLDLVFQNPIPESATAPSVSSQWYGTYAKGNYYEVVDDATKAGKFCWDLSNQSITATANQTVFDFTGLNYTDSQSASNSFNVYKNSGDGWILVPTADYSVASSGLANTPVVTLNTGAVVDVIYKARLLYGGRGYNKYKTGSNTANPLIPDFQNVSSQYFFDGKRFKGLYCDYATILQLVASTNEVTFETAGNEEIASTYLFDETTTTRPEPALPGDRTFATYNIDPKGYYSYRIGIKQQQQDYYNVYLPGIVNGYPIDGNTEERGKTAFTTLISDNINKVPRNLQDVGPLQNQFTSDITMWPRVTNIEQVNSSGLPAYSVYSKQFFPSTSPDDVELVGTVKDIFPDIVFSIPPALPTAGEFNTNCMYDPETKPYLAKIGTRLPIGRPEEDWTNPGSGTNEPYPGAMSLAVYETKPVTVPFEIFYETSTSDLISDINSAIYGANTEINGMTTPTIDFNEGMPIGTQITTDIYPTINGTLYAGAAGELVSMYPYLPNAGETGPAGLDTSVNFAINGGPNNGPRFIRGIANAGSVFLETADTFYYGADGGGIDSGLGHSYAGLFQYTIRWTDQTTFTQYDLSGQVELTPNIAPLIAPGILGGTLNSNTQWIYGGQGTISGSFGAGGTSPIATNGSLRSSNETNYGNKSIFNLGAGQANQCWSFYQLDITDVNGNTTTYTSQTDLDARFRIMMSGLNGVIGDTDRSAGFNFMVQQATNPLVAGYCYTWYFRVQDTAGSTSDITVGPVCVPALNYTTAIATTYTSLNPATGHTLGNQFTPKLIGNSTDQTPGWSGQVQNWHQSNLAYFYIRYRWTGSQQPNQALVVSLKNVIDNNSFQGNYPNGLNTQPSVTFTQAPGWTQNNNNYWNPGFSLASFLSGNSLTQSEKNINIAQGVTPGMEASSGSNSSITYPYGPVGAAVVNLLLQVDQAPWTSASFGSDNFEVELMFGPGTSVSQGVNSLSTATSTVPPFYPNQQNASSGGNIGPTFTPITNL